MVCFVDTWRDDVFRSFDPESGQRWLSQKAFYQGCAVLYLRILRPLFLVGHASVAEDFFAVIHQLSGLTSHITIPWPVMSLSFPAGLRTTNIMHKADLQLSSIHRKVFDGKSRIQPTCRLDPGFSVFGKDPHFSKKNVRLTSDKIGTGNRKRVARTVQAAAGSQSTGA